MIRRFCYSCQKIVKIMPVKFTGELYEGKEVWLAMCSLCQRPFSSTIFGPPIILI